MYIQVKEKKKPPAAFKKKKDENNSASVGGYLNLSEAREVIKPEVVDDKPIVPPVETFGEVMKKKEDTGEV